MSTASEPTTSATPRRDGRDARWAQHRQTRREELVEAALRAIRQHGATVGMDEVAAVAGTSKTVVYRHLGDRLGLYLAVCDTVDAWAIKDFSRALESATDGSNPLALEKDPRVALIAVIDSYLRLVERDPEVYRFITRRPLVNLPIEQDPVAGLSDTIAAALAEVFGASLRARNLDDSAATAWSHGMVGFVRESADRWLVDPHRPPREQIVQHLADLLAYGLTGVLQCAPPTPPSAPVSSGTSTTQE